jgi:anaerobic selenocysteine-containing dehydrogenase
MSGAALTEEEYREMNPQGRAIIKAADYIPPLEEPDADYPFACTTGRVLHHFHTRTKTGRVKELNDAAPTSFAQISEEDAAALGIAEGDAIEIESRRGKIRVRARIGDIARGCVFVPFHYGDVDAIDGSRAANELTITAWDPVSKQPYFKFAAVKITKI